MGECLGPKSAVSLYFSLFSPFSVIYSVPLKQSYWDCHLQAFKRNTEHINISQRS